MGLGFNEDSFFNHWACRLVNFILLVSLPSITLLWLLNMLESWNLLLAIGGAIIMGSLIGASISLKAIEETEFFEWDKRERKRKRDFMVMYTMIAIVLSTLLSLVILALFIKDESATLETFQKVICSLTIIIYIINIINIPSLHYLLLEEALELPTNIAPMPDHWEQD